MKGTETFQKVIKEYLDKRAAEDELFAKDYQKPGKTIFTSRSVCSIG